MVSASREHTELQLTRMMEVPSSLIGRRSANGRDAPRQQVAESPAESHGITGTMMFELRW